mgnify:FL=1
MLIEWQSKFDIGVARLDEQHRQLVEMLNSLYQVIGPDTQPQDIWRLFGSFNRYADTHFTLEERMAKKYGLAANELQQHWSEHESYRQRMRGFARALESGDRHTPVQMMSFLNHWWTAHICGADRELGRKLGARGAN